MPLENETDSSYLDQDARNAQQFFGALISPLKHPDEELVRRTMERATTAAPRTTASVPAAVTPTGDVSQRAAQGALDVAGELRQRAAQIPDVAQEGQPYQAAVDRYSTPINPRDAGGKLLPQYRPTTGQKILRGLAGAGMGLMRGGVLGAAAGAISPHTAGEPGYGDPNSAYERQELSRQQNEQSALNQKKGWMARVQQQTDTAKAAGGILNQAREGYQTAGTTANNDEKNSIRQQADQQRADLQQQLNDIRQQQADDKRDAATKAGDLKSQNLDLQRQLIEGKIRELDAKAGLERTKAEQAKGGRPGHVKDRQTFESKWQADFNKMEKKYNDQRQQVSKSYGADKDQKNYDDNKADIEFKFADIERSRSEEKSKLQQEKDAEAAQYGVYGAPQVSPAAPAGAPAAGEDAQVAHTGKKQPAPQVGQIVMVDGKRARVTGFNPKTNKPRVEILGQ